MKFLGKKLHSKSLRSLVREVSRIVTHDPRVTRVQKRVRKEFISRSKDLRESAIHFAAFVAGLPGSYVNGANFQVGRSSEGWIVTERGSSIPLHVSTRKQEAMREARRMAREHKGHVEVLT